ncbi:MAG: hypothetical protein HN392_11525 [Anaerolineae bacterium]|jgi:hypothetical protein|nr:hypothetical protein [Anaerolineae bacterium]
MYNFDDDFLNPFGKKKKKNNPFDIFNKYYFNLSLNNLLEQPTPKITLAPDITSLISDVSDEDFRKSLIKWLKENDKKGK